jgi:Ca-activated chloride channel family protein
MREVLKRFMVLILAAAFLVGCGSANYTESSVQVKKMSIEEADKTLETWMTRLNPEIREPQIDLDVSNEYIEELLPLDSFEINVEGNGDVNIEIWASTEKSTPKSATNNNDSWLLDVAEKFNRQNNRLLNGQTVTVSVRTIASGDAAQYIIAGRAVECDAFSPSTEQWGELIVANGVELDLVEKRLAGNTAGILMKKSVYDEYIKNHGDIDLAELIDACIAEEITLGYTNPYASSTALNALSQFLLSIDPSDPLGASAEAKFNELQRHLPPPAYTTAQMRESAKKGFIDVMVMESQAYVNEPTLSDYVFTPFGVRHDNPVYVFSNIVSEKSEGLKMFIEFCKNTENQEAATKVGFNDHEEYVEQPSMSGEDLYRAQALWKKNKTGGKPTVAVFVADVSGSMSGDRITYLKESLLNSIQYIGEDNEIGIVSFASDVVIELPIGKFQGEQRGKFSSAVKNLALRGSTRMYSGTLVALNMIKEHKEASGGEANYMVFVLTDGETDGGVSEELCSRLIVSYGIPVHAIGYSEDADMVAIKRLASYMEGFSIQVTEENVTYNFKNMFNSQM